MVQIGRRSNPAETVTQFIYEVEKTGKPALLYDLRCQGTKSYLALADEFLDRTLMIDVPPPRAEVSSS